MDIKTKILFIAYIALLFSLADLAMALSQPNTSIVAGPNGNISYNDVAFWWTGETTVSNDSGRLPAIKGFYYSLDGELWNWTQERYIAYYDLPDGEHKFYVKSADSNDQQDISPAFRIFTINNKPIAESDEGKILLSLPAIEYQSNLNNKILSGKLRQEFLFKGVSLSANAKITVVDKDNEWYVSDGSRTYYIKLEDENISVYGTINDSSGMAATISPNKSIACKSFTSKNGVDEDWFRIKIDRDPETSLVPRQMAIAFKRPDAAVSSIIKIYRFPDTVPGKEIGSFEVKDRGYFATGVDPGEYLIHIKPTNESVESAYYLTVTTDTLTSGIAWDTEPNSNSTNATETSPIFLSQAKPWIDIAGNKWGTNDDKDWYRVHIDTTTRKRMSVNITRPKSGLVTIRLYSFSPMSLLGEFTATPESGSQWKLEIGTGLADYVVEVDLSQYESSVADVWKTPYFISFQLSDFPKGEIWEVEPNNSIDFADRLTIGTRVRALRNQTNDTDWFRLDVPEDGILSLVATRISKSGSINVNLLDLAGQLLASEEISTGQQKGTLNINITKGQYYVNTEFADFSGDYWLTAILIKSIAYDIPEDKILTVGDEININLVWEKGNTANFDILYDDSSKKLNDKPIEMFDDGLHGDGNANDGVYAGKYVIKEKDNADDAVIVVHVIDQYGNSPDITIEDKEIIIDIKPPVINQISHDAEAPLSVGKELTVTIKGEPKNQATFDIISNEDKTQSIKGLIAYDDGKHNDGAKDDGTYVGVYTIKADDYITDAILTGYLTDEAGNKAYLSAVIRIDIVGDRPVILSVEHDGRITLGEGNILTVNMAGDAGGIASFDIEGLANNVPMYDDGKHNDGEQGDGKYSGTYTVKEGDGVVNAILKAYLTDRKGKSSSKTAIVKVNIDAISPQPVMGLKASDRPNDQGRVIDLTWQMATEIDFSHYNIYVSKDVPISISKDRPINIGPTKSDIYDKSKTSAEIKVTDNLVDYYFAITAVDIMGNESLLDKNGRSIAGPVQAKDNLLPTPVKTVGAIDRPNDYGGMIILSWTDVNIDEDFVKYNVYQDINPIETVKGLEPIDTITDRQLRIIDISVDSSITDYYFAVTCVDMSGNESILAEDGGSVAGPVRAENNIGDQPLTPFALLGGLIGIIHYNNVAFHWSQFAVGADNQPTGIRGYYIKLDGRNWQWTTETSAVFYNLSSGRHKFSVRLPESLSNYTIERDFEISPVLTSEKEPNDSSENASQLRIGVITRGEGNGSEDWFRLHIPSTASACIVNLLLSYSNAPDSLKMTVYSNQPFRQIAESQNDGISPLSFVFGAESEADYLIKIEAQAGYRLVATLDKLPQGYIWETEGNDSADRADYLEIGDIPAKEIAGNVIASDSDWFRIHVAGSAKDPSGLSIAKMRDNPISIKIYPARIENGQIGEISGNNNTFAGIVKPGTDYYINVVSEQNTPYRIYTALTDIPTDQGKFREIESNDLAIQANPLTIGEAKYGTNWDGNGDRDFYKLNLAEDGILNIQFLRPNGAGSSIIEVLNSASQTIGTFTADAVSGQKGNISLKVKAGTHYVKITPEGESPSAEYSIIAMFIESIKVIYRSPDSKEIPIGTPLKTGDSIVIELKWDAVGGKASFSIGEKIDEINMPEVSKGLFRGSYIISQGDDISNAQIMLHIEDKASNRAEIALDSINVGVVDSEPPKIIEVTHDGNKPLTDGEILTVSMIGEPGGRAKFDISGFKTGIDMYNMFSKKAVPPLAILNWNWGFDQTFGEKGSIKISGEVKNISEQTLDLAKIRYTLYDVEDEVIKSASAYTTPSRIAPEVIASFVIFADYTGKEKSAKIELLYGSDETLVGETVDNYGVYTGIYKIKENDNIQDAEIACYLIDPAGNQAKASAVQRVSIDNTPPTINSLSYNSDKVFVEGDIITVQVNGEPNCEATFDIGDFRTGIKMTAENGLYSGVYRVRSGDEASNVLIKAHLKDLAGNVADYIGTQAITISTTAPAISSIIVNTLARSFIENEIIIVTAKTEIGVTATLDIEGLITDRPMYDDGKHDDEAEDDGIYVGAYTIRKGDNVKEARIKVKTLSKNGKAVDRYALEKISVDTTPPLAITGLKAVDKPDDEGEFIVLSWKASDDEAFKEYRVYQSNEFITSVNNLSPLDISLTDRNITSVEIKVPMPVLDTSQPQHYFAVTAVDIATNESILGRESSAGPVSSEDNLPPLPVIKVSGYDRKFDHGKVIVITWSQSSVAKDFHNYNVYMGYSPIDIDGIVPESYMLVDSSITDRNVRLANITVAEDGIPYYFTVTAVDKSGNESRITADSITDAIISEDNLGAEPDTIVRIISGPVGEINHNDVTFQWSRWYSGVEHLGYYYRLDNGSWIWTNEVSKTYRNLNEGLHTFYVRADLGANNVDPMPSSRTFSIKRITMLESEPNNTVDRANWIPKGMTLTGTNTDGMDDDWYRFHVESNGNILSLHFDRITGDLTTQVTVYRSLPPNEESAIGNITITPLNNRASLTLGVGVGDYYVLVNSAEESSESKYELSVAMYQLMQGMGDIVYWDTEDNDKPILAQTLGRWNMSEKTDYSVDVAGIGNSVDDVDWYKAQFTGLNSSEATFLNIDFIRPRAGGTTEISIYSSLPVAETPKVGSIVYMPGILPVQAISVPIRSGDYYIKIDNQQEAGTNNIYSMRISASTKQETWELEPNNISQMANPLAINKVIKGTNWDPNDDVDWYRMRVNERQMLVVSIFRPTGQGTTEIKLMGSDLTEIASANTNAFTGHKATIGASVNVGDYFISITPSAETNRLSEYELVATTLKTTYSANRVNKPNIDSDMPLSVGDIITLEASWIAGNMITYDIGDIATGLMMYDDGEHGDSKSSDGLYAGSYTIQSGNDISDAKILLHLEMPPVRQEGLNPRWIADFRLKNQATGDDVLVNIDTTPPKIFSVTHDMPIKPLSADKILNVTMTGEIQAKDAFFTIEIASEGQENLIFRGMEFQMTEDPEGTFKGNYTVAEGDDITNALVICHLVDDAGNESQKASQRAVFFDTIPPEIISIEHNANEVLVEGDMLIVHASSDTKNGKATFGIGDLITSLPMYDDGTRNDENANDGIYTGRYTIKKGDNVTDVLISVKLEDEAGNVSEKTSREPISIDTTPPNIESFVHNANNKILIAGNKLFVTMKADPGNIATFDIGEFIKGLPMYDDGTRSDEEANDGIYIGEYLVRKNDLVKNARLTGYLTNKNGNQSISVIFERINIDAVSPEPVLGVSASDKTEDDGFWVVLTWSMLDQMSDFSNFNIYRESTPITSTRGLTPIIDDGSMKLNIASTNQAEVNVPTNRTDYYFAITLVDSAGNESGLDLSRGGSTFGPVRASDDISPNPVSIVSAYDRPNDQGQIMVVSWTNPALAADFAHYAIYLSREPIMSLDGLKPVMEATRRDLVDISSHESSEGTQPTEQRKLGVYVSVPFDEIEYYFAVAAVDESGNRSDLDENGGSVAGPAMTKDNTPPDAVALFDVIDTLGDDGGYITVIWIPNTDEKIQHYNIYLHDEFIDNEVIESLQPADIVFPDYVSTSGSGMINYGIETPYDFVYVAVTAVDFGDNESSLDKSGGSSVGPVQAVSNIIQTNRETRISAGFDPYTSVVIPAGTFGKQETIDILWPDADIFMKIDEADKLIEKSHIDPFIDKNFAETVRLFKSSSPKLSKQVTISLTYPDISDMQNMSETLEQEDERSFRIFRLNEASRVPKWELVTGQQQVDIKQNIVSANVSNFGVFRVARLKLPENLDRVVVYPNPFIPSQSINGYITFRNLTENITIRIYTLDGREVKSIEKIGGGDRATWNALNNNNEEVASGTYIYVIQNESQTQIGKVMIMR